VEGFSPGFAVNDAGNVMMPSMIMIIMLAATGVIVSACQYNSRLL
jgi:anaerobic C4-dicarboxylate transporter DcuA